MKLILLVIPLLAGFVPASAVCGVIDPGEARGFVPGLRRLVGWVLALATFVVGVAAGLLLIGVAL